MLVLGPNRLSRMELLYVSPFPYPALIIPSNAAGLTVHATNICTMDIHCDDVHQKTTSAILVYSWYSFAA